MIEYLLDDLIMPVMLSVTTDDDDSEFSRTYDDRTLVSNPTVLVLLKNANSCEYSFDDVMMNVLGFLDPYHSLRAADTDRQGYT